MDPLHPSYASVTRKRRSSSAVHCRAITARTLTSACLRYLLLTYLFTYLLTYLLTDLLTCLLAYLLAIALACRTS